MKGNGQTQSTIRSYFAQLGLSSDIANIYYSLNRNGPQNISQLARSSGVERTKVYRLLDTLSKKHLVEIEKQHKRIIIHPAPISNIDILIGQQKNRLKTLERKLPLLESILTPSLQQNQTTSVQFYRGAEGVRHMQWNLLRAKGEILSIMHEGMQAATGDAFFKLWADRWNQNNNSVRLLADEYFLSTSNDWHTTHPGYTVHGHTMRVLPADVMQIDFSSDIYDNTVSYYSWQNDEIFGIEILNSGIAAGQRIFFEKLWSESLPEGGRDLGVTRQNQKIATIPDDDFSF